jgi:hypothetical protein
MPASIRALSRMKSATETKDNATVLETGMDQVLKLLVSTYQERLHSASYGWAPQHSPHSGTKLARRPARGSSVLSS